MLDILMVPVKDLKVTENTQVVKVFPHKDSRLVVYKDDDGVHYSVICRADGKDIHSEGKLVTLTRNKEYRYKTMEEFVRSGFVIEELHPGLVKVTNGSGITIAIRYYMFGMKLQEPIKTYPGYYLDAFCEEMDR